MARNILIGAKLDNIQKIKGQLEKGLNQLGKDVQLNISKVDIGDIDKITNQIQNKINKISKQIDFNISNIKINNDNILQDFNSKIKQGLNNDVKINTDFGDFKRVSNEFDEILLKAKKNVSEVTLLNGELAKMNTILDRNNNVKSTTLTYQIDSAQQAIEKYGWKAKEVNGEVVQSFELISRKITDNKQKLENEAISQDKFLTNLENKLNKIKELSINGHLVNENYNNVKDLESIVHIQNKINEIKSKNVKLSQEEKNVINQSVKELENLIQKETSYADKINQSRNFLEKQIRTLENLKNKVADKGGNNVSEQSRLTEELDKQINKYQELINKNEILGNVEKNRINSSINSMRMQTNELTKHENKFSKIIEKVKDYAIGGSIIYGGIAAAKEGFNDILEVDTAMTDLKKVTNETTQEYENFKNQANEVSKILGNSTVDIIKNTSAFAQMSYTYKESQELAKNAAIFQNVGDINQEEASKGLIATMKSFGIQAKDSMDIIDKLNAVSNSYSISVGGLNDAIMRGASALSVANNDLSQSIALITTANSAVQDQYKVVLSRNA